MTYESTRFSWGQHACTGIKRSSPEGLLPSRVSWLQKGKILLPLCKKLIDIVLKIKKWQLEKNETNFRKSLVGKMLNIDLKIKNTFFLSKLFGFSLQVGAYGWTRHSGAKVVYPELVQIGKRSWHEFCPQNMLYHPEIETFFAVGPGTDPDPSLDAHFSLFDNVRQIFKYS